MNIKSMIFAINAHQAVNHMYDKKPYSIHLILVNQFINKFIDCVPEQEYQNIIDAGWLHDTIEDCRISYNEIKNEFGETVADLVYALTNSKGKSRDERASAIYYNEMKLVPFATYVKLCDRIANAFYSKKSNSHMLAVYQKENNHFLDSLLSANSKTYYKEPCDFLRNILC